MEKRDDIPEPKGTDGINKNVCRDILQKQSHCIAVEDGRNHVTLLF